MCTLFRFLFYFYVSHALIFIFFFFNDTATTEIYTLSLHDALPISVPAAAGPVPGLHRSLLDVERHSHDLVDRSEEHTSELQSPDHLVCRLLLEKKKKKKEIPIIVNKKYNIFPIMR